ncbi:MAG: iron-containing alcohol dehydrogenase [Syntrophaceae bacterium]|nr:iron-containing alcohol dehydrogenase [Syntrophaceae bacterium]
MLNFTFYNPTKIIFGRETIKEIAAEIPPGAKVLVTSGGDSARRYGVLAEVRAALKNHAVFEFSGIEPNPTYETLLRAVRDVQDRHIDFLLAVGGGSVIDGTKFIAAAAHYPGDPWDIVSSHGAGISRTIPLGTVLTLPATGSEMNPTGVVTRRSIRTKFVFKSPLIYPKFSVLDPTKSFTLPATQIGNGVVDTFVHVAEQYLTYPVEGKVQDRFAEGLMLTLIEEGPRALAEPQNYDVRANLMWCATLGLNGLLSAGVPQDWATHMVGHELTALFGLDHGKTLAVLLPAMLEIRRDEKRAKLLQYASRVWNLDAGSEDERIDRAIEKTRAFFESMRLKTRLCDYGLGAEAIPLVLEQLKAHDMVALGENRSVTPERVEKILGRCL